MSVGGHFLYGLLSKEGPASLQPFDKHPSPCMCLFGCLRPIWTLKKKMTGKRISQVGTKSASLKAGRSLCLSLCTDIPPSVYIIYKYSYEVCGGLDGKRSLERILMMYKGQQNTLISSPVLPIWRI